MLFLISPGNRYGGDSTKMCIPIVWVEYMGISREDREILVTFDYDNKIITIQKSKK